MAEFAQPATYLAARSGTCRFICRMNSKTRSHIEARAAAGNHESRFLLSVLLQRESGVTLAPAARTITTHSNGAAHWTTLPGGRPFPCKECQSRPTLQHDPLPPGHPRTSLILHLMD